MKALIKNKDSLSVKSVAYPCLETDDEAIIEVKVAGLCRTDIYVSNGNIQANTEDGTIILGHELSGTLVEAGDNYHFTNKDLAPGNKVTVNPFLSCNKCKFCNEQKPLHCINNKFLGIDLNGCFAEYVRVPLNSIYKLPDKIKFESAAYTEPIAASLAVLKSNIKPEEKGLILGKNRFSQLLIRLLSLKGYTHIDNFEPESFQDIQKNTYDYVIETSIFPGIFEIMLNSICPGGKIILKSRQNENLELSPLIAIKKEPIIHILNYGSFEEAIEILLSGELQLNDLVEGYFKLEDFQTVFKNSTNTESLKSFFIPSLG